MVWTGGELFLYNELGQVAGGFALPLSIQVVFKIPNLKACSYFEVTHAQKNPHLYSTPTSILFQVHFLNKKACLAAHKY